MEVYPSSIVEKGQIYFEGSEKYDQCAQPTKVWMTGSVIPKRWEMTALKMTALNQNVGLRASHLGEVEQAAAQGECPGNAWAVDDFVYEVCELQGSSLHRVPYAYAVDFG
jgi:hypothetical protein